MRYLWLFLTMLLVFWCTNTWVLAYGVNSHRSDFEFAFALTVIFGTLVAIPLFPFFFAVDFAASYLAFPWNVLTFIGVVLLGCALFALVTHFGRADAWPASYDAWVVYLRAYLPVGASATVMVLYRLKRREPG